MNKISVGQSVWLDTQSGPQERRVVSVGRKYFEIETEYKRCSKKFYIETLREKTEYGAGGVVYLNKQDVVDVIDRRRIEPKIRKSFDLPIEKLRRIEKIIDENNKKMEMQ